MKNGIETGSIDKALLCTVFHEIENKDSLFSEIMRIVKKDGRLVVIEFHKSKTPMGPPVIHRVSKEEVMLISTKYGFRTVEDFILGDNFYCIVFQKTSNKF